MKKPSLLSLISWMVLLAGQGAFATSFQMGGDFFTRALARLRNCSEESAESLKRERDFLSGADANPEFAGVVDGWVAELKRHMDEWFRHNAGAASDPSSFEMVASGGGFAQAGLLKYIKAKAELELRPWPKPSRPDGAAPAKFFEVAFGTALQALGHSAQPVSLLPDDYRAAWQKRLGRQRLEFASLGLVMICILLLAIGTWHKWSLISRKQALLDKVKAAQDAVVFNKALTEELINGYDSLRPIFAAQQNTVDTLKTLALLQQSRSNRSFWYVLLADQQSYFKPPASFAVTNQLARTNLSNAASERPPAIFNAFPGFSAALTNTAPAKPGYIAELCVPQDAEGARRELASLVNKLKQEPLFSKADLLSDDLRRNLRVAQVVCLIA